MENGKRLAEAHVGWYMARFDEQSAMWKRMTDIMLEFMSENMRQIAIDNFVHGYKHGEEGDTENKSDNKIKFYYTDPVRPVRPEYNKFSGDISILPKMEAMQKKPYDE